MLFRGEETREALVRYREEDVQIEERGRPRISVREAAAAAVVRVATIARLDLARRS